MANVWLAYLLWLLGGPLGLHHFYLHRDKHCLLYTLTFGGFLLGWLRDLFKIPEYVAAANKSEYYLNKLRNKMMYHKTPSLGTCRLLAEIVLPSCLQPVVVNFISSDEDLEMGVHKLLFTVILPPVIAFGIWLPGNVGDQRMNFKKIVQYCYACCIVLFPFINKNTGGLPIIITLLLANMYAKSWPCNRLPISPTTEDPNVTSARQTQISDQLDNRVHKSLFVRIFVVAMIPGLLFGLCSYHAIAIAHIEINGESVPLTKVLSDLYNGIDWSDLWVFYERFEWNNFINTITEPSEADRAYKLLNLSESSTMAQVRTRCRDLAKEHHPDKFKTQEEKSKHEIEYRIIQNACDTLKARLKRRSIPPM